MRIQIDSGTRLHTTFPRFVRSQRCPHCSDTLLAPTYSEFVMGGEIRHYWSCETCGLVSQTLIGSVPN